MGELRQHHPSLRISKVKALQKGDLLVVSDSPQDAVILQSESKMKASLGKNVKVSLPKPTKLQSRKTSVLWSMSPELYTRWKNFASLFRSDSASTVSVSATRHKIVNQSKNA